MKAIIIDAQTGNISEEEFEPIPISKEQKIEEILAELEELDTTINRATEDLYTLTNTTPYQKTAEVIARKEELRQELKELKELEV